MVFGGDLLAGCQAKTTPQTPIDRDDRERDSQPDPFCQFPRRDVNVAGVFLFKGYRLRHQDSKEEHDQHQQCEVNTGHMQAVHLPTVEFIAERHAHFAFIQNPKVDLKDHSRDQRDNDAERRGACAD